MSYLIECPYCEGKGTVSKGTLDNGNEGKKIICSICGAQTAVYESEELASAAWNKRQPQFSFIETVIMIVVLFFMILLLADSLFS